MVPTRLEQFTAIVELAIDNASCPRPLERHPSCHVLTSILDSLYFSVSYPDADTLSKISIRQSVRQYALRRPALVPK